GVLTVLAISVFGTVGNFAAFFEVAAATRLDGSHNRVRLLPLLMFGFMVSLIAVSATTLRQLIFGKRPLVWHKTERYRSGNGNGNGHREPIGAGANGRTNGAGNGPGNGRGNGYGSRSANER